METEDIKTLAHRGTVRLPEVLDMRAAAPLAAELLERRGRDVDLDASGVRRLGAQCLQVLLAARSSWESDGAAFHVVLPSSGFVEGLALLGAPSFSQPSGV
jgi:chemotaxis protein CheX